MLNWVRRFRYIGTALKRLCRGNPMSPNPYSTFHYHACGHAFNAHFTRPFDELIEVQAASSLPITGGHGKHASRIFSFVNIYPFAKATLMSPAPTNKTIAAITRW